MTNVAPTPASGMSTSLLVFTAPNSETSATAAQQQVTPLLQGILERDRQNGLDVRRLKELLTRAHTKNVRLELVVRVSTYT